MGEIFAFIFWIIIFAIGSYYHTKHYYVIAIEIVKSKSKRYNYLLKLINELDMQRLPESYVTTWPVRTRAQLKTSTSNDT